VIKKLVITLAVLIVVGVGGLLIAISLQPDSFSVERSMVMGAAPSDIFPRVDDLAAWQDWSPWTDLDPDPKRTFSTPSSGKGATFDWTGNDAVGEGRLTILESLPGERVAIEQAFVRPFEGKATMTFTFAPEGAGTLVTWRMDGKNGFIGKAICLFVDMDAMLGPDFERGLGNMKRLVERAGGATEI
jgi:hypothetical protein